MKVRSPAVAGTFYPAVASVLTALVDRLVGAVDVSRDDRLAEAYIVPHAGYRYSGPVAAQVYARLLRHAGDIGRVVLIGPAHRARLTGVAVSAAHRWLTPLGEVPVDRAGAQALASAGLAVIDEGPHVTEHSLEVQVPFLQRVLGEEVEILPICVGQCPDDQVAAVIAAASVASAGTVLLCSTDFSHYLSDQEARERDARTASAVLELSPDRLGVGAACGIFALRGLLSWARAEAGCRPERLALATAAETGGDPARVVGYPAFALRRATTI